MAKQIALRIPKSLHERLVAEAKAEGVSLNQYIVYVLSSRTGMVLDRDAPVDAAGKE